MKSLLDKEVSFPGSAPVNTARDVDLPQADPGDYKVSVTNPSKVPVTVHVKRAQPLSQEFGGTDHFPEVAVFTVDAGSEKVVSEVVEKLDLTVGGRITVTLDSGLEPGGAFAARVLVALA